MRFGLLADIGKPVHSTGLTCDPPALFVVHGAELTKDYALHWYRMRLIASRSNDDAWYGRRRCLDALLDRKRRARAPNAPSYRSPVRSALATPFSSRLSIGERAQVR